jgi:hypothetical protein
VRNLPGDLWLERCDEHERERMNRRPRKEAEHWHVFIKTARSHYFHSGFNVHIPLADRIHDSQILIIMHHNPHNSPIVPKVLLFFVDFALRHEAPEPTSHDKPPLPHP